MAIDLAGIVNAVVSHAAASGHFERVNQHEPPNPPGHGLSCAVWVDGVKPHAKASGLAVTGALLTLNVRIYTTLATQPLDEVDGHIYAAVDALMTAYNGDFQLGGLVQSVDLLGRDGAGLSAQAGYIQQDGKPFRVMTITLPIVINDAWTQVA